MKEDFFEGQAFVYAKKFLRHSWCGNQLEVLLEDSLGGSFILAISFWENALLRIRIGDKDMSLPWDAVNPEGLTAEEDLDLIDQEGELEAIFAGWRLCIAKDPFQFSIFSPQGERVYQENTDDVDPVGEGEARIPSLGFLLNDKGEKTATCLAAQLDWNEQIFGLGERFTQWNRLGQNIIIRNKDTLGCRDNTAYKNIPFYLSSRGYGLFINSHVMSRFDVGYSSTNSLHMQVPGEQLEYYLLLGTPPKIVGQFSQLTGPAALPPEWSFSLWYSTSFKGSSREEVEKDTQRFRQEDFPCGVFHFDCYWLRDDHWCDFVWDESLYPHHLEMLKGLKDQGYHICLWINPYVTIKTEMFLEGKEKGYFIKNQRGEPYQADLWHGLLSECVIVDFTNPEATTWYQDKVKTLLHEGVDALKTDFGEDIPLDSLFYNGMTGAEMRNQYAYLYNQAVFAATKEVKGDKDALVWARSGFSGMQRFPLCWSGDPRSSFSGMANTLKAGLSLGLCGVPFWSHDMGGFYGQVEAEVFVRWSQFGFFSSHCRLHGTTTRQPWAYGEDAYEILKNFAHIREQLRPYIWEMAQKSVVTGLPMIRPLYLMHPEDPAVLSLWDQYYFGDTMLVVPVFGGHNSLRQFYLPQGIWQDYLTKELLEGGRWYQKICPLDYMPIFTLKTTN